MVRHFVIVALTVVLIFCVACGGGPTKPIPLPPALELGDPVPLPDDPRRQFDFWLGEWDVTNKRATRGGSWNDAGNATARIQSVVDGGAVLEQWDGELSGDPLFGFSLRAYDETLDRWSVWLNWTGDAPNGFSEMRGRRNGERMELFPPDDQRHLRYGFAQARTQSCQWEKATSSDGQTWITDWVMQFKRREEPLPVDAGNAPLARPPASAAEFPQTRALDFVLGAWDGQGYSIAPNGDQQEGAVKVRVTPMIRGLGLLQFLDAQWGEKNLTALGWDRAADGWVALHVDNQRSGITKMAGELETRGVRFTAAGVGLRESWSCRGDNDCSWSRETSADGGTSWKTVAGAELRRSTGTAAWIDIRNAKAPFDQVLTGGQVTADQLAYAARNGYRTIVNLRGPGEAGALADEAKIVEELGMRYVVIPMSSGDDLNEENASKLAETLSAEDALPAMVHCASGNRVGALFGMKAHFVDGLDAETSLEIAIEAGVTRLEPLLRQRLDLPQE